MMLRSHTKAAVNIFIFAQRRSINYISNTVVLKSLLKERLVNLYLSIYICVSI